MTQAHPLLAALEKGGALLVDKPEGISSAAVIERLQRALIALTGVRKRDLPAMGHGGTLDPFATGLLVVAIGEGTKVLRYFLGSDKRYEGVIRFGETTIPGDPTEEISERSSSIPDGIEGIRSAAAAFTRGEYLQIPPMHSAKKRGGKPLYELARAGIEVEREPKACRILRFDIPEWNPPRARFDVACTSGTYIRVLAQDLGKRLGTVAMLDSLRRAASGSFELKHAETLDALEATARDGRSWTDLTCWIPFDDLLEGMPTAHASPEEALALIQGRQHALPPIVARASTASEAREALSFDRVVIREGQQIRAVARRENGIWVIERVFGVSDRT